MRSSCPSFPLSTGRCIEILPNPVSTFSNWHDRTTFTLLAASALKILCCEHPDSDVCEPEEYPETKLQMNIRIIGMFVSALIIIKRLLKTGFKVALMPKGQRHTQPIVVARNCIECTKWGLCCVLRFRRYKALLSFYGLEKVPFLPLWLENWSTLERVYISWWQALAIVWSYSTIESIQKTKFKTSSSEVGRNLQMAVTSSSEGLWRPSGVTTISHSHHAMRSSHYHCSVLILASTGHLITEEWPVGIHKHVVSPSNSLCRSSNSFPKVWFCD